MAKGASGIKAGAAYIELTLRDTVSQGLRSAQKRVELFGEKINELGSSIAMAGAAVTAFGGAIVGAVTASVAAFTKIAGDFSDLAAQTGLSVELMSELETALKDAGSTVEDFAASAIKMRKAIYQAFNGSEEAKAAISALGLSAADLIKLSADQQFLKVADALSKMKNPTERTALAMELFGKSAYKMLPVLEAGGAGIEAFRQKARDMGFSLSGETADAADALGTQIEILKDQFGRIAVAIGEALLPVAQAFVSVMQGLVGRVIEFVRENQGLVLGVTAAGVALLTVGTAVGAVGAGLVALGTVISETATVVGIFTAAISAIIPAATAAWTAVTGPVGIVVAAIAAAAGIAIYASGAFETLWRAGVSSAGGIADAWQGVTDAIASNDWKLAGEISMSAMEIAFYEGVNAIRLAFTKLFAWLVEAWTRTARVLVSVANPILAIIDALGLGIADKVEAQIASAMEEMVKAREDLDKQQMEPLKDGMKKLIEKARTQRGDAQPVRPTIAPIIGDPTPPEIKDPKAPKDPKEPTLKIPKLKEAQAEIQARLSAMGGFNAAALGGMIGGNDEMVTQQKRSNEFLSKLLEQGKRNRDSLAWS